jgi:hypothetical protein
MDRLNPAKPSIDGVPAVICILKTRPGESSSPGQDSGLPRNCRDIQMKPLHQHHMENYGNHTDTAASQCMNARCNLLQGAGAKQPTPRIFRGDEDIPGRRDGELENKPPLAPNAMSTNSQIHPLFSKPSTSCTIKFNYHEIECNIQITSIHPSVLPSICPVPTHRILISLA